MIRTLLAMMVLWAALAGCQTDKVDRHIGGACDSNSQCDNRCLTPSADYPGGLCTVSCNLDSDCGRDDVTCADKEGGVCLFLCRDDSDCAFLDTAGNPAWVCKEVDAKAGGKVMVCRGN